MTHDIPLLMISPLLARVAEKASLAGATKLMSEFGGQEITIPAIPRPGQVLATHCGMDVARVMAEFKGGEKIGIPNGAALRSKKAAILKAQGSVNQIAKATGSTSRYVRMIRNAEPRPMPLLDILDNAGD